MKYKKLLFKLLISLFLIAISANSSFAHDFLVVHAINAQGDWQKGEVTQREVIFTNKVKVESEINIDVPRSGKYQLLAYVHHNWRNHAPCIYVKGLDAEGKVHKGNACIENCWYFKEKEAGRWFMVSFLDGEPFWVLPKGKLQIKFWMDGKKGIWDDTIVSPEGEVAIEDFFLVPAEEEKSKVFLSGIIYPETGTGNWKVFDYHPEYGTDLVISDKPGSLLGCKVSIPVSGHYQGWISSLADADDLLKIRIKKAKFKREIKVKLKRAKNWALVPLEPFYLEKGEYILSFENSKARVLIDYFLLLPLMKD